MGQEALQAGLARNSLGAGLGGHFAGIAPRREAPSAEIDGVEGDAKEVGGDEAELGGAHPNDADNGAVDGTDDPALPEFLAEEDGAENGQNAGDVIQPNFLE